MAIIRGGLSSELMRLN